MKKRTRKRVRIAIFTCCLILGLLGFTGVRIVNVETVSDEASAFAAVGGSKVKHLYENWSAGHEARGGDRNVVMKLGYQKGLSSEYTLAAGRAELDLVEGTVSVSVEGLAEDSDWEVWLVDNRGGVESSVRPEASDETISLGRLAADGTTAALEVDLGSEVFEQFQVDMITVARAGSEPAEGLIFGQTPLFQRLYTVIGNDELLKVSDFRDLPGVVTPDDVTMSVGMAYAADTIIDPDVLLDALVAQGAELFLNETFNGNGRTCGTCHPSAANFALNAIDIARLPDDDPLFAAEFIPALAFTEAGDKFEVPVLMRGNALIVENNDGMGDLANNFNMRGIPHTLALPNALTPAAPADGSTVPPVERTGWSGDGSPGDGSLRSFATGAVTQHFPLTLGRVDGVDFRLPSDPELDAMEAFQLSLGRPTDLTLPLNLKGPVALKGQEVFMGAGGCNVCHANAGANFLFGPPQNRNFNTGVESQVDRPMDLILEFLNLDLTPAEPSNRVSPDGGFGTVGDPTLAGFASPEVGVGTLATGFGNGSFNTPVIVEAADTGPFFHDNSISTIEGAVAFYNSDAFNNSPVSAVVQIDIEATHVQAVASFLRVINALENLRSAREISDAAKGLDGPTARELLRQAAEELGDAHRVLVGADLHPDAVLAIEEAIVHNIGARAAVFGFVRDARIDLSIEDMDLATDDMIGP